MVPANGNCHAILAIMEATLDKFGRLVVPKAIRDRLGLRAGAKLDVEARDGNLVLSPHRERPDVKRVDGILVFTGELLEDSGEFLQSERELRDRRISGWLE